MPALKKVFLSAVLLAFIGSAYADDKPNGCEIKKERIKQQIKVAKQYGNSHRVVGLERALRNIDTYCTPDKLHLEYKNEVQEYRAEIHKLEKELNKEVTKGNKKKIKQYERKIDKATKELNDVIDEAEEIIGFRF